jgi:starch-binding outer membrane protein, SusD/RagB family
MVNWIYKKYMKTLSFVFAGAALTLTMLTGCEKYLDVVPDNVATLDNAFTLRNEAEKYLFTLYAYLPKNGDGWYNAGLMSGDEIFLPLGIPNSFHAAFQIALGQQNSNLPLFDEWSGTRKGGSSGNNNAWNHQKMWVGINHCNRFIENIVKPGNVADMDSLEINQWVAEAKVLKAYFHFHLFKMYGPIPIMKENVEVSPDPTIKRQPIDSVVNYVTTLIDQAVPDLPRVQIRSTRLGRMDKSIALAIKAKMLLYAASPLFNGNPDYAGFVDNEGVQLFPLEYQVSKWESARDALAAAITSAEGSGHFLYQYMDDTRDLSPQTLRELTIRNSVTTRWAPEHVWGLSNSYFNNQFLCMPPPERSSASRFNLWGQWCAPIKIAKQFYSKNGVPIEEDKTLDFSNYLGVRKAVIADRYYIEPNYVTARLNFDREPRFYASLGFDGGVWYMADANDKGADESNYYLKTKNNDRAGFGFYNAYSETGYYIKKLVSEQSATNGSLQWREYPWPEIRLADLYLMYAETLNETDDQTLAIQYVDTVRARAGLNGVENSWVSFSINPGKFSTQDGLREIIHQERLIELVFEGHRFWDLRRWKKAAEYLNEPITGLTIRAETAEKYNVEREVFQQRFAAPRDYFWPIEINEIRKNPNLVQNPGW